MSSNERQRNPWSWVPSLYFAEGIPYVVVNTISVVMYKKLGVSNADITFWTSLLAFAWVIKPLWGPLVDLYWTKRRWVLLTQGFLGLMFGVTAVVLRMPDAMIWWGTLSTLALVAFLSATHDIAADGFYMIGLNEHHQSLFVGIRSTFYRVAMIVGQGLLLMLAGQIEMTTGPRPADISVHAVPKGQSAAMVESKQRADAFLIVNPSVLSVDAGTTVAATASLRDDAKTTVVVSVTRRSTSRLSAFFPFGPEQLISVKTDQLIFSPHGPKTLPMVFQADAKLKAPVNVTFDASSGNIALTWSYCFGGLTLLFLGLCIWHSIVLPISDRDGAAAGEAKKPFAVAVFWLFSAICLPIGLYTGAFYVLKYLLVKAIGEKVGENSIPPEAFTFLSNALVILLTYTIYLSRRVRTGSVLGFRFAAINSGIRFDQVFASFFRKKNIGRMLAFLLLYRLGESLLVKMSGPFLLDAREKGGVGLTQAEYGLAYGTIGILALTFGGILGGVVAASGGLKKWIWFMAAAINIPHLAYVYLAWFQPEFGPIVLSCVAIETFGYGFGFAAYMLYMLYIAGDGEHKTTHFALCTGFMALGMMLPGMISGSIQQLLAKVLGSGHLGYTWFFILVCLCVIPSAFAVTMIPLDPEFGKKKKQ